MLIKELYKRPTIASLFWVIGGFLSLVTRLTNLVLNSYQSFTIDKSMLKKIFSYEEMPIDESKFDPISNSSTKNQKLKDLEETIKSR